jgi:hypothetical protein
MEDPLGIWEYEGGSPRQSPAHVLMGTVNQIAWARQIRDQINAEFDRVRRVLESATRNRAADDRQVTEAIIVILEDKRAEVMARSEAGYFIHDWQELRTQVRDLILQDSRFKAKEASSSNPCRT